MSSKKERKPQSIPHAKDLYSGTMVYNHDYDVKLKTGTIVEKDQEPWEADDDMEYKDLLTEAPAAQAAPAPTGAITDTDAKQIALSDAGFVESDVRMIKCEKDFDDGIEKYDVDFYGPNGMKYEYDIRVSDGAIIDKDAEFDDWSSHLPKKKII